jgi:hypothetical protein
MEKILRRLYMVADAVGFSSRFVAVFTFATRYLHALRRAQSIELKLALLLGIVLGLFEDSLQVLG